MRKDGNATFIVGRLNSLISVLSGDFFNLFPKGRWDGKTLPSRKKRYTALNVNALLAIGRFRNGYVAFCVFH